MYLTSEALKYTSALEGHTGIVDTSSPPLEPFRTQPTLLPWSFTRTNARPIPRCGELVSRALELFSNAHLKRMIALTVIFTFIGTHRLVPSDGHPREGGSDKVEDSADGTALEA